MSTTSKFNLDELASNIVRCFPTLNLVEQRLSLELYRLLAEGQAVPRTALAERLEVPNETIIQGWLNREQESRFLSYEAVHILGASDER